MEIKSKAQMFNRYFWGKVRYCEKAENVDVSKFDWFIMEVIVKALGSKENACGNKSLKVCIP